MLSDCTNLTSNELYSWILSWPSESISRLKTINESTGSAKHVVLTVAYSVYDRKICQIGQMITSLLLARMRAERSGQEQQVARINKFMLSVHESIDKATGVSRTYESETACNRIVSLKAVKQQ